jgi:hypothetical protein
VRLRWFSFQAFVVMNVLTVFFEMIISYLIVKEDKTLESYGLNAGKPQGDNVYL